ncbi:restriction endonuclease subunit S [Microbacterium resistens]|uniref:Restriction endonuclease subunit S n=1 Tax=Microbacterium resistens TaxID=156977 RepID=A0ABY3RUR7_9MICO|nr:restriction endonuclease subunit S [Microbacterium resistens]UGS27808.1 restriction endonuclease subunit S [Microbacterium resistens]
MSHIDGLITELAPEGVEFKTLGDIGEFIRGNGLQKSDLTDEGAPAIHYGQVHTHYGVWAETTKSFTDPALAAKLRRANPGDLVIATTSEDDAAVAKATAWLGRGEVAVSGDAYIYRHTVDPRYVSYFFQSERFQEQKVRYITGTKVRRVSGDALAKIRIPVPPPEVQREIVRILDQFTQLEAELEAELEARRRQYEYYRSSLLAFGDEVDRAFLGDIATIGTGSHDTKDAVADGEYMFYARGREPLRLDSFDFDESAIITAGDGVGVGKVFHFATGQYALHQRAYRIVPNEGVDARYIYHYLVTDFARYLERNSVHASVTSLRRPMFLKYPVPLPPLDEQRRISSDLDKFDALVKDLSVGLPAELEARRKQYEYYRDKLLTFKEVV